MAGSLKGLDRSPPPAEPPDSIEGSSSPVLILGVPRSGTSWLGKIFDSHPSVIYRHEPDLVVRPTDFPVPCPIEAVPQHVAAARRYVARLTRVRQVKTSGTRPVFAKPFQPFPAPLLRRILALGLRVSESIVPRAEWPRRIPIPDFVHHRVAGLTYVIKSVNLLGAAVLLATALPESRIVVVFRHPCGQIASVKRQPSSPLFVGGMFGVTREGYERLPELDRIVRASALLHEKIFREAESVGNICLLRYEDLCCDPMEKARAVMAFARVPWAEETRRFIERSTRGGGRERYFSVFRDPMEAATKWKRQLDAAEISRYMAIVDEVMPGRFSVD